MFDIYIIMVSKRFESVNSLSVESIKEAISNIVISEDFTNFTVKDMFFEPQGLDAVCFDFDVRTWSNRNYQIKNDYMQYDLELDVEYQLFLLYLNLNDLYTVYLFFHELLIENKLNNISYKRFEGLAKLHKWKDRKETFDKEKHDFENASVIEANTQRLDSIDNTINENVYTDLETVNLSKKIINDCIRELDLNKDIKASKKLDLVNKYSKTLNRLNTEEKQLRESVKL